MNIITNIFSIVKKNLSMIFHYRSSAVGFSIVLVVIILGFGAPLIASRGYDYISLTERFKPPSLTYPFGTDALGRDVFSRVIYGARIALWVGLLVVMIE
jgi:peptide/nickel transport system permease protein